MYDVDLDSAARQLKIPYFRGVYMLDSMPPPPAWRNESMIVNLDTSDGPGTHWVCFSKRGSRVRYFDSYGDLRPPKEVLRYLGKNVVVTYNKTAYQGFNTAICGQLCLAFLRKQHK